jgi:hypothetical protein
MANRQTKAALETITTTSRPINSLTHTSNSLAVISNPDTPRRISSLLTINHINILLTKSLHIRQEVTDIHLQIVTTCPALRLIKRTTGVKSQIHKSGKEFRIALRRGNFVSFHLIAHFVLLYLYLSKFHDSHSPPEVFRVQVLY